MTLEKWLDKYGRKQNIVVCDSDGNAIFTMVADPELEALEEDPMLDEWEYTHYSWGEKPDKTLWGKWAPQGIVTHYQRDGQFDTLALEVVKTSRDRSKDLLVLYLEPEVYMDVDSQEQELYHLSDLKKMWREEKRNGELEEEEERSFDRWLERRMLENNGSLERLPY